MTTSFSFVEALLRCSLRELTMLLGEFEVLARSLSIRRRKGFTMLEEVAFRD